VRGGDDDISDWIFSEDMGVRSEVLASVVQGKGRAGRCEVKDIALGWPQWIWIAVAFISLGVHIAKHGEDRPPREYNFFWALLGVVGSFAFLYWGGFFTVSK